MSRGCGVSLTYILLNLLEKIIWTKMLVACGDAQQPRLGYWRCLKEIKTNIFAG